MQVRTLEIREDSYRNRKINIRACGKAFFPTDSYGGSTKAKQAVKLLTLKVDGVDREIKTDIPRHKNGSIRWFFRDRTWVRPFLEKNNLNAGDKINLVKESKLSLKINWSLRYG